MAIRSVKSYGARPRTHIRAVRGILPEEIQNKSGIMEEREKKMIWATFGYSPCNAAHRRISEEQTNRSFEQKEKIGSLKFLK